ncbi:MAG TPA: hypothetical protein VG796_11955 [Verrucomicrobiales bacterium]|nr:hypothetical protein [Verrucomicrobiales bacterium]
MNTLHALCTLALAPAAMGGSPPTPVDKNPAPSPADPCAGLISYSHVELLYQYTDFNGGELDDGSGATLRFEYEVMKPVYVTADVDYLSYDYGRGFDGEQWRISLGAGGHISLTGNIDLAGDAGFVYSNESSDPIGATIARRDEDGSGWFMRPHFRAKWGCFTVHAGASLYDVDSHNDGWSGYGRLYYQITPSLDLTAGASFGDEADVFSGGVRWRF